MTEKRNRVHIRVESKKGLQIIILLVLLILIIFALPFFGKFFLGKAIQGSSQSDTMQPSKSLKQTGLKSSLPPPGQALPVPLAKQLQHEGIIFESNPQTGRISFTKKGIIELYIDGVSAVDIQQMQAVGLATDTDVLLDQRGVYIERGSITGIQGKPATAIIKRFVKVSQIVILDNKNDYYRFIKGTSSSFRVEKLALCTSCAIIEGPNFVEIHMPEGFHSGYGFVFQDAPVNNPPTQETPLLNASSALNLTSDTLLCTPRGLVDPESDPIYTVTSYSVDGQPFELLNLAFDVNRSEAGQNSTDYSLMQFRAFLGTSAAGTAPMFVGTSSAVYGGAYEFDGSDDIITILDSSALSFSMSDFAIEGWINAQINPNVPAQEYNVISKLSLTGIGYELVYGISDQSLQFSMSDGISTIAVSSGTNSVPIGTYKHFAVTVSRSDGIKLYIDGRFVASSSISGLGAVGNSANVIIGQGTSGAFKGLIDNLRFYSAALSANQVADHGRGAYNTIVSDQTQPGQQWRCSVTPTDLKDDGLPKLSNSLQIRQPTVNNPPTHTKPIIMGETLSNRSIEDITCYNQSVSDPENNPVVTIIDFNVSNMTYNFVHLPFEGHVNSSIYAVDYGAGGNRKGDVHNAAFDANAGAIGGAYIFSSASNSYVNLTDSPDFVFSSSNNITWEAWFATTAQNGVVFAKQTGRPSESAYSLQVVNGKAVFTLSDGATTKSLQSGSVVNDGTYKHVAVTKDRSINLLRLYINGVNEATDTDTFTGPIGSNGADLVIGSLNKDTGFFSGSIDELRIYKRALSAVEIQSHTAKNYHIVKGTETLRGDAWACSVTLSDGVDVSITRISDPFIIRNTPPLQDQPLLVSSSGAFRDSDNLTCVNQNTRDPDGDFVANVYDFIINSTLFTRLNLPFEAHDNASKIVIDYSRTANGTVFGARFGQRRGFVNNSGFYEFDGIDDRIVFDGKHYNPLGGSLALEVWFNLTSYKDSSTLLVKVNTSDAGSRSSLAYGLRLGQGVPPPSGSGTQDELQFFYGNASSKSVYETVDANIALNKFYHAVVVKRPGFLPEMYINGARKGTICRTQSGGFSNCNIGLRLSNGTLVIGRDPSLASDTYFKGVIDYVAFFNRTLSAALIKQRNFTDYHFMSSDDTQLGQLWGCQITPNDGYEDGLTATSQTVDIIEAAIRPGDGSGDHVSSRLPNYTFDVRYQNTAIYTLMINHRVKILGVGKEIYVLILDRSYDLGGVFSTYKKKAIFFLVPRIGTLELYERDSIDLDLDGYNGYDITLRVRSIQEKTVEIELQRYGYRPGSIFIPGLPYVPPGGAGTPTSSGGSQQTVSSPPSYRAPAEEEPATLSSRIDYGTIGVVALLIAIIITIVILIKKLRV